MRIILLTCVAAMGVAEQESRASERAMDDAHTTDTFRKSDTELWIPKIIRDDLCAKATDFVTRVFPDVDQEWLRAQLDKGLGPDTYIDIRGASRQRPQIRIGDLPLVDISLPDARHMALFPSGTIGQYVVPPGVVMDTPEDPITLDDAETRAREVLARLVGNRQRAAQFRLRHSGEAPLGFNYFQFREANTDQLSLLGLRININIGRADSMIQEVWLWYPNARPRISYAQALAVAKETGLNGPRRVWFATVFRAGVDTPVWQYFIPPEPGGGGDEDVTWWDANTGELLYSEVLRGGTAREPYRNPAFFVEVTDELVMRNVEKMLLDRVAELKRQAKERPDANKP